MKKYNYWNTNKDILEKVKKEIENTASEIERYEGQEGIVEIILDESLGINIYRVFMEAFGIVKDEEDFNEKYLDQDGMVMMDEVLYEMDKKFDDINEELEEWVKEFDLVPAGYVMDFGWYDGNICTMLYPIS